MGGIHLTNALREAVSFHSMQQGGLHSSVLLLHAQGEQLSGLDWIWDTHQCTECDWIDLARLWGVFSTSIFCGDKVRVGWVWVYFSFGGSREKVRCQQRMKQDLLLHMLFASLGFIPCAMSFGRMSREGN